MSDLLRELWSRADCEEPVFSAEEVEWAPPGQVELLSSLGLLKETDRATWARCEACGDGHVEDVVWVQNATTGRSAPFVPCPENGGAAREDAHALWDRCRQIADAPSPVILVPSQTPAERKTPAFRLADLASIYDRIVVDLDYLGEALPSERGVTPAKTMASFPVPADATWADLRLVVREHTIVARLRDREQEFGFEDLGLSGIDDRLWQLLCTLARVRGQTPARSRTVSEKGAATFRKQVSDLRQRLSTVFPIDGEPIRAVHGTGGYRCLFQISLDRTDGFPVQPERWDDCRFTELPDGRIAISVRTKEVFAARSISEETARRTDLEAGERFSLRTEEYDLRALGLADQVGRPTREGRALLEFLRNGGKLTRRGDDKDILRLGLKLQRWIGIEAEPFRFTLSRMLWSSEFESASDRSGRRTN